MTPEEVRALSDAELDVLVAENVFGWERSVFTQVNAPGYVHRQDGARYVEYRHPVTKHTIVGPFLENSPFPTYIRFSTDGNAMLALIERMGTRGYEMLIIPGDGVTFFRNRAAVSESQNPVLPRAVAEAAVLAVMKEERA